MKRIKILCSVLVCALTFALGFVFVNGSVTRAKADETAVTEYSAIKAENSWLKSDKRIAFQIDKNNRPADGDYAINGGSITLERNGQKYSRTEGMTLTIYTFEGDCVAYMELWQFGNNLGETYTRNVGDVFTIEGQFGNIKIKTCTISVAYNDMLFMDGTEGGIADSSKSTVDTVSVDVTIWTAKNWCFKLTEKVFTNPTEGRYYIKPLSVENLIVIRNGVKYIAGNTGANSFVSDDGEVFVSANAWALPGDLQNTDAQAGDVVIVGGAFTDGVNTYNIAYTKIKIISTSDTAPEQHLVFGCSFVGADGVKTDYEYDVTDREDVLAAMKKKIGKDNAEWKYSANLPEILPEKNGMVYTETRTKKTYTVTWNNFDGTELKSESVEYGIIPSYSEIPTKVSDKDGEYVFNGWDKEIVAVTEDVTYTAIYTTIAHELGEWTNVENPTCLDKGIRSRTCTNSGCIYSETEELVALGHEMGEFTETQKPTCTEKGVKTRVCTRENCTYSETEELAALGHEMGEFTETKKPTCTEKGVKTRICTREDCTYSETEELVALGHKIEKVEKVDATVEKEGVKEHYRCSECGKLFSDAAGATIISEEDLKIAKLEKASGCNGSINGSTIALSLIGVMALFVFRKKRT